MLENRQRQCQGLTIRRIAYTIELLTYGQLTSSHRALICP